MQQQRTSATATASPLTVAEASSTPPDITQTAMYRQFQASAAVGQDVRTIADTAANAFQSILAQRPDLADANFDFVSDQGTLKVVSGDLSDADRHWLEGQLNANSGLVDAVNQFNTDMTTAYDGTGQLARVGSSDRDTGFKYQNVADGIDGSVKFLSMIQQLANKAGQTGWLDDATYSDEQGAAIDLAAAKATSLSGMIDLQRQLSAVQDGSVVAQLGNGRTLHGAVRNPGIYADAGKVAAASLSASLVPSGGADDAGPGQIVDRLA